MKRFFLALVAMFLAVPLSAQQVPPRATAFATAPDIPYESVPTFLKMPPNIYLGEGIGVARNSKGRIFIFTRSGDTRLFEFDQNGTFVREIGQGLYGFEMAHGVRVDSQDNIWTVDEGTNMVVKFSPEGKVMLTLGKPGVRGTPPEALTDPTDVLTDPGNGDVYVAESHTDVTDPNLVGRISVFDRSGKFLRVIGKTGTGPGEFRTPHAIEFDSQGRLVVADRHNHRIQILTREGTFIAAYSEFGRTSGLAIDASDVIYTADSESTERVHPGWQRGVRIGSLRDGKVTIFVPPHAVPNSEDGAMGEGIAVDAAGNVFTAEAQLRGITKYVRN